MPKNIKLVSKIMATKPLPIHHLSSKGRFKRFYGSSRRSSQLRQLIPQK
jgi:hypothetical protein